MVGVGALATKKKLKCQACGEYNDVGNAKPSASAKAAQRDAAMAAYQAQAQPVQQPAVDPSGRGWHRDPVGRFHQRFFDGTQWTQHVTDGAGVQQVDPGPINTI